MIRFLCPLCHRTLKASEGKAGATIVCPRCQELSVVPSSDSASARTEQGRTAVPIERGSVVGGRADKAGAHFWGMSDRLRSVVVGVAAVGVLSLLLAVLAPVFHLSADSTVTIRQGAVLSVTSCLLMLLILLHGHGMSCPACGKLWSKTEGQTQCLGREEFQKNGLPWVRASRRTTYQCKHCRHTWSATFTDEYRGSVGGHSSTRSG
jgi:phage FluMu protein Com